MLLQTPAGEFSREEYFFSGHNACPGCAAALTVRHMIRILGPYSIFVITASCWSVIAGVEQTCSLKTAAVHSPFPAGAAVASGLKKGLEALGDYKSQVVLIAGDGGTFDIGLQGLSGAAERNENIIFVCYDNEAYMNTGMQRSSATPYASYSTTTPAPMVNPNPKKDIVQIIAAHQVPYLATATIAFPEDLMAKFSRALKINGFRFFHILSPCPPGWGSDSSATVELSRLAVMTRLFPLLEVENGTKYTLNYVPQQYSPVQDYMKLQGRFSFLERYHMDMIQENLEHNWTRLVELAHRGR